LNERALFPEFIKDTPDPGTGIIVVVPAYNEPGIKELLTSLAGCSEPSCAVEVIIVINAPPDAPDEHIRNNRQTLEDIESWKNENIGCFFRLFSFVAEPSLPRWGVGMARKTGMDEALRRFDSLDRPEGVILCLDADCTVEKNYFISVCDELFKRKDHSACSICFEHAITGKGFPQEIYKSIILYELHLRYYFQGLLYTGFPYVFHTIGSSLAVKALPYLKAGGMNRKQAGEDFYFIQKLVPSGGYFNLNSTTVYPSPRTSFRVPFGTGATMQKLSIEGNQLLTYNFNAFADLKKAFSLIESFYESG
jgi:glycosyltransferase involved in cell wall biosynthesis